MLWVNLIMDTFAALALATEPPNPEVLGRSPRQAEAFIITGAMAKQIAFLGCGFLVLMVGILEYEMRDGTINTYELSVFFAIFVFLQLWNLFNARCFGLSISAFTGLSKNPAFSAIIATIFIGQVAMVQWGSSAFRTVPWPAAIGYGLSEEPLLCCGSGKFGAKCKARLNNFDYCRQPNQLRHRWKRSPWRFWAMCCANSARWAGVSTSRMSNICRKWRSAKSWRRFVMVRCWASN